jgi:hypothetical protein
VRSNARKTSAVPPSKTSDARARPVGLTHFMLR